MKSVEEKYHLIAETKLGGKYYVDYVCIGGGFYEFALSKYPIRYQNALSKCSYLKDTLVRLINNDYYLSENGDFTSIDDELIEEVGGIDNVRVQKVTTVSVISYIN